MKIEFTSKVPMTSKGTNFTEGSIFDIKDAEAIRLVNTFPLKFKIVEPVAEPIVEPTIEPKKTSRPSRSNKTKTE